jgi:hypothetical protein
MDEDDQPDELDNDQDEELRLCYVDGPYTLKGLGNDAWLTGCPLCGIDCHNRVSDEDREAMELEYFGPDNPDNLPTYDDFYPKYKPRNNHILPDASWEGRLFETYGTEYEYVKTQAEHQTVWTILDCDGQMIIAAGLRYVNRFGYLITEVPWETGDETFLCV